MHSHVCLCMLQGVDASHGGLQLVSHGIWDTLGIDVSVLMGANIANEVAQEMFCEATIGRLCVRYCVCDEVWFGEVWCGLVWCGVVWCGVVWCGVVHMWYGVVHMWYGVVHMWYGVVHMWYGVVHMWYGVVHMWYGVVHMWCIEVYIA